ncbi:PREDICTED: vertnin [Tauraco erythrolophus]|uniref:vertnin n=1 Tax=Tauraco erythrolophus TaxID=121530 RepID=UPI000523DE7B|nr:PREDICTED: vertnin [Tauraco erythrolophus]
MPPTHQFRMIQRHQLVQSVLQELQEATECFGLEGLTSAALEAERTLSSFSLPGYCARQFQEELEVDRVARSLYPEDAPSNMLPLVCKGEGNRLFEAASVLLWGNPSLSLELQVRTVVEMLLHKQYYLNGMIDSKVMLQAARYSLCTEETPEMTSLPMAILEAIFDADIKATCFPGTFANMWHVYALASVLQCNIYSIYPMSNLKIRPYFNRLIRPRKCGPRTSTLHIMWSGQQLSRQVFKAQYFVAVVGLEELEPTMPSPEPPVQPMKTLELLNSDPQLTYSNLRDRYSITKSTFYRWKRQSREHRQKAAARFAAKHFLQSCFQEGNIIPLQHFRQMFPEISRSTYYAWKHEMQSMANGDASALAEAHRLQELHRVVPKKANVDEPANSGGSLRCPSPSLDPIQAGIFMQGAKSYLEKCISMNTLVPYRCFKRSFPGISRSTYYNWRRKAIKDNPNFKPPQSPLDNQKPLVIGKPFLQLKPSSMPVRKRLNGDQLAPRSLLQLKPSLCWRKQLRDVARRQVQQWRLPFLPGTSPGQPLNRVASLVPPRAEPGLKPQCHMEVATKHLDKTVPATPYNATISGYAMSERANSRMFVMDVIATAQFKAQAKLFLQQRFESKTFPTYKEFSARFPLTARSTYYMWKRALHDGLTLVDA